MAYTFDEAIVSDLHKDAHGFRPSAYFWRTWNAEGLSGKQIIWDALCRYLEQTQEREQDEVKRAISEYEVRIASYISIGAKDRATAIRWLVQSLELTETDDMFFTCVAEYICYTLGLPYSMQSEFSTTSK